MYGAYMTMPHYAIASAMHWFIHTAFNYVVLRMNELGTNSPKYPEYWMAGYLDQCWKLDNLCNTQYKPEAALRDWVNDTYTACASALEWAGHECNDEDAQREIFIRWADEMRRSIQMRFCDEWDDFEPGTPHWALNWRTEPVVKEPEYCWKTGGIIYRHEPGTGARL